MNKNLVLWNKLNEFSHADPWSKSILKNNFLVAVSDDVSAVICSACLEIYCNLNVNVVWSGIRDHYYAQLKYEIIHAAK